MAKTILIVEDDKDLLDYLREVITEKRYIVHTASTGTKALKIFIKVNPNLVLLDLHLPDIDGESLLSQFKKILPSTHVIVLTGESGSPTIVRILESGADDFISKPFKSEELFARIHARLRDKHSNPNNLTVGDLNIDLEKLEVTIKGKVTELSVTEFELLRYLVENKNKVLTRDMILSRVWATDPNVETRVVDVYIGYLRKKIDLSKNKKLIVSKRGYGYMIKE